MKRKISSLVVVLLLIGRILYGQTASFMQQVYPYALPLKTAPGNRFLTDQSDQPFFWSGEAAWSLIAQLSMKDADLYLENRSMKGFTVIMVNLIEHKFCTNHPANIYKEKPFSGRLFATPNEKYFAHADSVIEAAARHNIVVLLAPLYLGYDCGDEGWCSEVKEAAPADLHLWGQYLGLRYKKFSNIIWLIGGDTDPSPVKDKVLEVVKGIRENDPVHLFSAHNQPESFAVTPWPGEKWLTVNNVYSYDSLVYKRYRKACEMSPSMPYFQIESAYENEHNSTPQQLRAQAYWAMLSGAMGHTFGNCPIWHFGSAEKWCNTVDWKNEMNNKGSESMDYLQRLFRSRTWQKLIPDFRNQIITSGYGSWDTRDHVACAATSDGSTILAYLPSSRSVVVNLTAIRGMKAKCRWYNPSGGKSSEIGTFSTSSTHSFTPPDQGDWILVVDNDSLKFAAPGSEMLVRAVKIRK